MTHASDREVDDGFIVHTVRWILDRHDYWGAASYFRPGQRPVDFYLAICWTLEGVGLTYSSAEHWVGWVPFLVVIGLCYRLADLVHVLLKRMIFGQYERSSLENNRHGSRERALILALFNLAELIAIYAGLFRILGVCWPSAFAVEPALKTFWDALDLSAGRALTVGWNGAMSGHGALLLGISETAVSVLIIVMFVSQLAGKPIGEELRN